MPIVRPRLTDYYGVPLTQAQADFAIPFLDEDIPLYLDPFLLWRSPSQQDNALHTAIINSFNHLGYLHKQGKAPQAISILTALSECDEVGFGHSHTRAGRRIGKDTARQTLELFSAVPEYDRRGFTHFYSARLEAVPFHFPRCARATLRLGSGLTDQASVAM